MLQAQPFYQRQKRLIWLFVMARIGHGLRGRYQFAKELPPILLSLIRTLEALEGNSSFGYAPPLEGRGVDTVVVESLKALDPNRPIREADIGKRKAPF